MDQLDLMDAGHFTPEPWISSFSQGKFSRIDHILGHKSSLSKLKKKKKKLNHFKHLF